MTEKDAARLPEDADVWALRMRPEVTAPDALMALIDGLRA